MPQYLRKWKCNRGTNIPNTKADQIADRSQSSSLWAGLNICEYLESCEGRVWQREDTLRILERAEQIDTLIVCLMRAAGVEIVE